MSVLISAVDEESIAQECGIEPGDRLLSINGNEINDILDYQFYVNSEELTLVIEEKGKEYILDIEKDEDEDLGLVFETYLMDKHRRCKNKCVFCFIDQLPKGMRESLYFKDDDSRLSFLFGNFVTLTNLTEHDVSRIINMHISPINISVHTTNPELRVKMMNNKNAGDALKILDQLAAHGIAINCQIVLCPGINDGKELERTLADLSALFPAVRSIAIVPVGLSDHREGLCPLIPFTEESAKAAIELVDGFGDNFFKTHGTRLCYLADEFYLKTGRQPPEYDYYEGFGQLEDGVGLWAYLDKTFCDAINNESPRSVAKRKISIATGTLAAPLIEKLAKMASDKFNGLEFCVYPIVNNFFGKAINVAGLVTGQDIIKQLDGKELGSELLIPSSMLKADEDIFLDDVTTDELSERLNIKVTKVDNEGEDLLYSLLGERGE